MTIDLRQMNRPLSIFGNFFYLYENIIQKSHKVLIVNILYENKIQASEYEPTEKPF